MLTLINIISYLFTARTISSQIPFASIESFFLTYQTYAFILSFSGIYISITETYRYKQLVSNDYSDLDLQAISWLWRFVTLLIPATLLWGADLQSEHERFLVEKHFKKPVTLYNYPANIKAFYMRLNEDEKTVAAMDVLFPGIGEIIGGSQREERYDVLKQKIADMGIEEKDIWWYLDTRKFGTAPHSGFGLGFERMIQFITGMGNIRDVIPFPRTPGSAEF